MIQNKNTNVNTTFIVEPIDGQSLSACTALYTNFITPCFDDTIYFSDNINVLGNFSGTSVYATAFYSGGTNLLDIINGNDTYITGGTFNNITDTLTLKRNDNVNINITGFTDYYITGFTYDNLNNLTLFNNNNTTLKTNISTFSGLTINGNLNVTGLTNLNQIIINNLTATTISATTYLNLPLDIYVTGGTYSNGTVTLKNNTGGTFKDRKSVV
jgi:hypothetical protein